jgi:hypothetical protein
MEEKKLKPVTFVQGRYLFNRQNTYQQTLLLKALTVTQDPKKLREMIGVKAVADVYRTLDKMAMRKEYHEALARNGISFDYIIEGIKEQADNAYKPSDKLKAYQILLKSLGMEKYEENQISGGSWEDELLRITGKVENEELPKEMLAPTDYEVKIPEVPESVKKIKEREKEEGKNLYE